MEETVLRHNQTRRSSSTLRKSALLLHGDTPSINDFDRKLSETDCYLQILLNQVASLKIKIDDPETTTEAKTKYEEIAEKAIAMTETIKHGIVLLQIAKNATLPDGSIPALDYARTDSKEQDLACGSPVSRPSRSKQPPKVIAALENTFSDNNIIETGIELGAECQEKQLPTASIPVVATLAPSKTPSSAGSPNLKPLKTTDIPEISYSSSEDDDFFDAEDDDEEEPITAPEMRTPPPNVPTSLDLVTNMPIEVHDLQSPLTPVEGRETEVDWDDLYKGEDESEVDMKSHGSVITHLLSQVRIGMDLTKIVLPTFILERRSLLEMYSDFFAHPDLFVSITDAKTPEERFVAALKWYLSSFHAGRRSSIAKKPYNPILGETFRCHWKLNEDHEKYVRNQANEQRGTKGEKDLLGSGPLPWCQVDDLVFVAEQVSHHPPISAFYAEHVKKRISVNAHIYTKSSFLGMSVSFFLH